MLLSLLAPLLFLSACDPADKDDTAVTGCTEIAMSSVTLSVVDADGSPVPDAAATFSVDGGAAEDCESFSGTFTCGYERAGTFTVEASAPGYADNSATVTIGMDAAGCHVVGQSITITLDQVDCTEEVRPSVLVHLWTMIDIPMENTAVSWALQNAEMASQPCTGSAMDWACGSEFAGDLEISASADGFHAPLTLVTVPMSEDGCHVITQSVEIEMLPD